MTHCVVFGGSRGIGAAIARQMLSQNYNVSIVSRCVENIKKFVDDAVETRYFARPMGVKGDVRDEDGVNEALKAVEKWFGPVNILVNAAGINKDSLLIRTSKVDIQSMLETNLIGSMITSKAVLKSMMQQKHGCIINIGSVVGQYGNAGQCAYSASKSGLMGFTKSLAKEVASRNIRVNMVVPGLIETDMTSSMTEKQKTSLGMIPLQRYGNPRDVALMVQCVVQCEYVTGQEFYVDGGLHLNL